MRLLGSDNLRIQEQAVWALVNISRWQANKMRMIESGLLDKLVRLQPHPAASFWDGRACPSHANAIHTRGAGVWGGGGGSLPLLRPAHVGCTRRDWWGG